jgi:hypothetical protein
MPPGPVCRLAALVCLGAAAPANAGAQAAADPPASARRFSVGGELAATIAPSDDEAFFNYSDYEQDTLRLGRARLFGEWRATEALQFVAELRIANGAGVELAAWYARWRPARDWPLDIQAGRIPPVIGAFARRAYGRDNPVFGAPLAYQYLISLRHDAAPAGVDDVLRMRGRGWQPIYPIGSSDPGPGIALVSSTAWDTGVQARWRWPRLEIAGALTRGSPSVPVVTETRTGVQWSGRAAADLPGGPVAGVSFARGRWLAHDVLRRLPDVPGFRGTQTIVGADAEYGRGAWLLRGEWLHAHYTLPLSSPAGAGLALSAHSGFAEVRWRPLPRWQFAGRADYLRFGAVAGLSVADGPWDAAVDRLEGVVNYRVTRHLDVRAGWQHNWRDGGRIRQRGFPIAGALYWF